MDDREKELRGMAMYEAMLADPKKFIETCFSIVDRRDRRVPFILNDLQSLFLKNRTPLDIVLKSRRMGFSAIISAFFTFKCMTRKNTKAVIVSHNEASAKRLFRRVKDFVDNCLYKVNLKIASAEEISFPDTNSWFWIGTAGNKQFGRGDDITLAHLSEAAFYDEYGLVAGVQEALGQSPDTWMVVETTANGAGNRFHEFWKRAIAGESRWKPHFFAWWMDRQNILNTPLTSLDEEEKRLREAFDLSNNQLAWRRMKLQEMEDPRLLPQEFPSTMEEAFLSSGAMVFDWLSLVKNEKVMIPPKWTGEIVDIGSRVDVVPDPKGPFQVYKSPSDSSKYLIVCDTGQGAVGGDYSVADVYDMRSWEQVAQWRGHRDPADFGKICACIGAMYGWSIIAPENNYPGNATIATLQELEYPNIWDEPDESGDELGFKTTARSRSIYVSAGRKAIKDGSLRINSKHTLNEMRTFIVLRNGKLGAQSGAHDDTVITACKAAHILKAINYEELPEGKKRFNDILRFKPSLKPSGGEYKTRVV